MSALLRWIEEPGRVGVPGTLGSIDDLYYRRVWQWSGAWNIVSEGYVRTFGINCTLDGPTFCSIGPPYIYERWHRFVFSTFGTGGSWEYAGERQNW